MTGIRPESRKNIFWDFFRSVRLTLVLLIILAITSILGTLIPQGEGAVEFAGRLSPAMFRLFSTLDLLDMYHSFWFRLLIGGLALNLIVCSMDRFPGTWKRFQAVMRPDRNKPFETLGPDHSFWIQGTTSDAASRVDQILAQRYKRIQKKLEGERHFFSGEKGKYAHFGVYLVHLSVLVIIVGALVGSFFGFEAFVNILEGEQVGTVALRSSGGGALRLGFQVRCDKFIVQFYENGAPKEYRSELTFLVDGKEVEKRNLLVNHPVTFRGITFYQSSYGTVPGKKVRLRITRSSSKSENRILEIETGHSIRLADDGGRVRVAQVRGDFMGMGPAALLEVHPAQGSTRSFWVFQHHEVIQKRFPGMIERFPKLNPFSYKPYGFYLEGLENRFYTGLQANKDPGVPVVWVGCFLMVSGFFVTFFTSHRRVWVRLSKEKGGTRISVAGTASKNPVGLERELDRLKGELKNRLLKGL